MSTPATNRSSVNRPPRIRSHCRPLLTKAVDSLILTLEHFNRPVERGRTTAVLLLLDHAFEMLLKAAILHRGGEILQPNQMAISFENCLRKATSDANIAFLTSNQVAVLRSINGLRNAEQHHIVMVSEGMLYVFIQSGTSIFCEILNQVFRRDLHSELPERVFPVATKPIADLSTVFYDEIELVRQLLRPGKRRRAEADARVRALATVENAFQGIGDLPSSTTINSAVKSIRNESKLDDLFPGVASISLTSNGYGPSLDLRINKNEGLAIRLVQADDSIDSPVTVVKRINELGFYTMGRNDLATRLGITQPMTSALIWYLKLRDDDEYFKQFPIGRSLHDRYSRKALVALEGALAHLNLDEVWKSYRRRFTQTE